MSEAEKPQGSGFRLWMLLPALGAAAVLAMFLLGLQRDDGGRYPRHRPACCGSGIRRDHRRGCRSYLGRHFSTRLFRKSTANTSPSSDTLTAIGCRN